MAAWLRRSLIRFAKTNRYTDGSGRALESNVLPKDLYLPPMSHRAYPRQTEAWKPTICVPQSSRKEMIVKYANDPSGSTSLCAHEAKSAVSGRKKEAKTTVPHPSHMETMMVIRPTPHKGTVLISGGGVLGLTTAALWGLRGWHTTVLERGLPVSSALTSPVCSTSLTSSSGRLRRPRFPDEKKQGRNTDGSPLPNSRPNSSASSYNQWPPFLELQYALINRRAADVFAEAGIPISILRECGVPVTGIMEHPGAYHSWISRGLTEFHPFAAKLLAVDMWALREKLEEHVFEDLKNDNVCVFYEHEIEVVYPLRQEVVIRSRERNEKQVSSSIAGNNILQDGNDENGQKGFFPHLSAKEVSHVVPTSVLKADSLSLMPSSENEKKLMTSLSISPMKWEKKYAKDAVHYDLLLSAEGANSTLRDLLDVEGFSVDVDFGIKWFLLRVHRRNHRWRPSYSQLGAEEREMRSGPVEGGQKEDDTSPSLSPTYIHRWLHACPLTWTSASSGISTSSPVPLVMAFPRIENQHASEEERFYYFSVMVYMPQKLLRERCDEDIFRTYLPDVWRKEEKYRQRLALQSPQTFSSLQEAQKTSSSFVSFVSTPTPAPTVFCEQLYNSVGLPNAVVLGDAAHFCNPFWLQQLPMALEDSLYLLKHVESTSRHVYDAIKQFSDERGVSGDALREITEKCLYYQCRKHRNPFLRFRNSYHRWMHSLMPAKVNTMYEGSTNHLYSRSIEEMFNGRGYASYDFVEKQQSKHRMFYHIGRLYT